MKEVVDAHISYWSRQIEMTNSAINRWKEREITIDTYIPCDIEVTKYL